MTADDLRPLCGIVTGVVLGAVLWTAAGCSVVTGLRVYRNGPATFVTGEPGAVRAYCTQALSRVRDNRGAAPGRASGCATWTTTTATVACPDGDGNCVAHELRHIVEPEWRHE